MHHLRTDVIFTETCLPDDGPTEWIHAQRPPTGRGIETADFGVEPQSPPDRELEPAQEEGKQISLLLGIPAAVGYRTYSDRHSLQLPGSSHPSVQIARRLRRIPSRQLGDV